MADDPELTDEERALLAADDKPTETEAEQAEADDESTPVEPAQKPKRNRGRADLSSSKLEEIDDANNTGQALTGLPYHGNPLAPPAQMDFGDPWGLLPVQMRHDADGNPVV